MREIIRCLIVGERVTVEMLVNIMALHFGYIVEVVATATTLGEGVKAIQETQPGLVIIDPDLRDSEGKNLFDYFSLPQFSTVFITAHAEHALTAIKKGVLDIILMPVTPAKISESLELYLKRHTQTFLNPKPLFMQNKSTTVTSWQEIRITLPTSNGYALYKASDIVYCKADLNYTHVYTDDNKSILISKPISYIERLLPEKLFYRIHKSHLVNLHFIKAFQKLDGYKVELLNGLKLDLAYRRKDDFLRAITHMS